MLTPAQRSRYLDRLDLQTPPPPTVETLVALHRAHLSRIPFENLDIHLGRPIRLDLGRIVDKLTGDRGGFCYELNGGFAALLETLGFGVARLEARVSAEGPGLPFDHLCLRVAAEGRELLADVGFGACFAEPLPLRCDEDLLDPDGTYRIEAGEPWWQLTGDGSPVYRFRLDPLPLSAFEPGCAHHQTSPDSHFTRGPVCTRVTPTGRVTLRGDRLIETIDGERVETTVPHEQLLDVYRERFGMHLPRIPGA